MDQERYDELCRQIYKYGHLLEVDRLVFYDLHTSVEKPDEEAIYRLLFEQRKQKIGNHHMRLSAIERKKIFKILEKKRRSTSGLNRFEYNYYNFLVWKYNLVSDAGQPCYPIIEEISLPDFENKFQTPKRSILIRALKKGLKRCLDYYKLNSITFIIGGSFLDLDKEHPKDIDVIILLPESVFSSDFSNDIQMGVFCLSIPHL